jgi:hypothetical protein
VQRFKDVGTLTFRPRQAILPALMRRAGLALVVLLGLTAAGCSTPCQELGDRLCTCSGGGTNADTCKQQIGNLLKDAGANSATESFCSAKLDTCHAPSEPAGVEFCDWLKTETGKVACGLANPPVAASAPEGP